jgi:hypothetical protein
LWSQVFESDFILSPKLDREGGVIFALENNEVFRAGPFSDFQKWELVQKPAVLLSVVYQGASRVLAIYKDGTAEITGANEKPVLMFPPRPACRSKQGWRSSGGIRGRQSGAHIT